MAPDRRHCNHAGSSLISSNSRAANLQRKTQKADRFWFAPGKGKTEIHQLFKGYVRSSDIRCSKFSLVWMGYGIPDFRRLRSESVGEGPGLDLTDDDQDIQNILKNMNLQPRLATKYNRILARYIADMRRTMGEVARVLSPNGTAVYVIGENTICGTYIRNSKIMSAVAELSGLKLEQCRTRTLPPNRRYLPPPTTQSNSGTMDLRMRREVVLKFTKPGGFGQADVLKSSPDIALPVAVPLDRQQVCQQ